MKILTKLLAKKGQNLKNMDILKGMVYAGVITYFLNAAIKVSENGAESSPISRLYLLLQKVLNRDRSKKDEIEIEANEKKQQVEIIQPEKK